MNYKTSTIALIIVMLSIVNQLHSQDDNSISITPKLSVKGYLETYYGYDFSPPENNQRPEVLYNFTNHNKFSINTGILGLNYSGRFLRSDISFILGSYAKQNLANEPNLFKHIYEANIGFKLLKEHSLWLDVGIMESNVGFESARSTECFTLSRSLLAESSPYYLNAAKLSYIPKSKKWEFEILFSNGWQQMMDGYPSVGHTVKYKPNKNWIINSSSFAGRVKIPGIVPLLTRKEFRFFHNFYAKYEKGKIGVIGGVDFGIDQLVGNRADIGSWVGIIGVFRYQFHKNWSASIRGEYFLDPSNSVASLDNVDGFENFGTSLNIDYHLGKRFMIRAEGRMLTGKEFHYSINNIPSQGNLYLGAAASVNLWK
jgi:hypothetical protein